MRTLVTGAAGFIGSNLVDTLAISGDVIGLDDLSTGSPDNLAHSAAKLVVGSILDVALLEDTMAGCDAVVHLAARPSVPRSIAEPRPSHDANATGTLNVLEAARATGVKHVVVASSSSVYGANPTLPKREDLAPAPLSPYAASKLATESYALAWQHSYGIKATAFRFFNVFGPRQMPGHAYAAVVPAFMHAALLGQPVTVHGDGLQSRDFTYVQTVCDVIAAAVSQGRANPGPINLAFGTRSTLLDIIDLLECMLGAPLERHHVDRRAGDVQHSQADNTLLTSLFPDIVPTPLTEGLQATLTWMQEHVKAGSSA